MVAIRLALVVGSNKATLCAQSQATADDATVTD